ncbi:MAG: hypothetical protein KY462_10135 [Actinobacteria bacterium]|nr:hypothetical protein [Actinomycetota bacterium]
MQRPRAAVGPIRRRSIVARIAAVAAAATLLVAAGAPRAEAVARSGDVPSWCDATADGYRCVAGPIPVPSGERVDLLSGVAAPPEAGYVTSARATLVDAEGREVHHHAVHLHHAVWLNSHRGDLTCETYGGTAPNYERFFATGSERTEAALPDGYGYHWVSPAQQADTDVPGWVLVAMLDGLAGHPEAFIQLDLGYVAEVDAADDIVPVRPVWLDVRNCSAHPVFTVEAGSGGGGVHEEVWTYQMPISGRFVFAGGHLHDGGLQLRLDNATAAAQLFTSDAIHSTPGPPWQLTGMTTFADPDGVPVESGDVLRLTAVYDSSRTWQDVMGIMVAMLAPPRPDAVDPPGDSPAVPDQPARDDDAVQPPATTSQPTASAGRPLIAVSAGGAGAVGLAVLVLTLRRRDRRR